MTIYDIAKHFNINISTVSKALSGSTDIAESTRKAVREYAEANGYQTRRARAKKGNIAILQGDDDIYPELLPLVAEAFRREAEKENYVVTVQTITGDFDLSAFLAAKPYVGIFVLGVNYNSLVARTLRTTELPAVIFGNQLCDTPRLSNVKSDDLVAVSNAIDYLVSLNHNLIAFLGTEKDSLVGAERFAGYFFGLSKNALPYRYDLTYFGDSTVQSGKDAAEYFLACNKYFTAIVCASHKSALGFIEYMQRSGKQVPEEVSVVCFDENCQTDVPLTTLAPNPDEIGKQAFAALKATVQGFPAQHVTVTYTLTNPTASCAEKKKFFSPD